MATIRSITAGFYLGIAAVAMTATSALSMPITVPTILSPGDQYRLAFVTSTKRDALSKIIAEYNTFVNDLGLAATGIDGWKVIGSTATVNARTNTDTLPLFAGGILGVPIYLLNDTKLVDSYDDLWDGTLDIPLNIHEDGTNAPTTAFETGVFTGTTSDGRGELEAGGTNDVLGDEVFNTSSTGGVIGGVTTAATIGWLRAFAGGEAFPQRFYALSPVLTAPAVQAMPEPGTLAILGLGLVGLGLARHKKAALTKEP